jgi:O-antigen/teichoic acid export membrane protein
MVKKYGIIGAPISTAICYIFGYIIILNIYYKKSIGLNIGRMFKEIFSGCALCLITTTLLSMLLLLIPGDGIGVFIIRCIGFCILYFILLWKYGFKDIERNDIISLFKKLNINLGK